MRTKTILYLSLILTAFAVQMVIGNPIPFAQYGFYVIIIALFMPYFGKWNAIKILIVLSSISMIRDIPFLMTIGQSWSSVYQGIMGVSKTAVLASATANSNVHVISSGSTIASLPTVELEISTHLNFNLQPYIETLLTKLPILSPAMMQTYLGNGMLIVGFLIIGVYLIAIRALFVITKLFKKMGIYNRVIF